MIKRPSADSGRLVATYGACVYGSVPQALNAYVMSIPDGPKRIGRSDYRFALLT